MDRKSAAILLGVTFGVAAVATTAAIYAARHHDSEPRDVNDVFDAARETVRKLDEALDLLRKTSASG